MKRNANAVRSGKPFALDEFGGAMGTGFGGAGSTYFDNDAMLASMFATLERLREAAMRFEYGLLLLDERKYGVDATLAFYRA